MGHDQRFVFESVQDAASIRKYLEAVMEGLDKGRLVVTTGAEEFVLASMPSGVLTTLPVPVPVTVRSNA